MARVVFDALMRDAAAQLAADRDRRRNGQEGRAVLPSRELLEALAEVADASLPDLIVGSASGTTLASVGDVRDAMITAAAAADLVGKSESYVRRLARSHRVRGRKVGTTWLVDPESLKSVLSRSAA